MKREVVQAMIALSCALLAAALFAGPPAGDSKVGAGRPLPNRPLFLDVFRSQDEPVVTKPVEWASAVGEQRGWLLRPKSDERLPALIVIANSGEDEFFLQSARDLAGIGYVVLIVPLERNAIGMPAGMSEAGQADAIRRERVLAQLGSAARWLRRREDVFPEKVGLLGWGKHARWALEAAAAHDLQAAVLIDVELPLALDAPLSFGLRRTAVLIIRGTSAATVLEREQLANLNRALTEARIEHRVFEFDHAKIGFLQAGFLQSGRRDAAETKSVDHAWFEIYEYLGKHVEDAEQKPTQVAGRGPDAAQPALPFVSIADVMRAVNGPTGVRGAVAESLSEAPQNEKDWKLLRARSAVMADAGVLLMSLKPPRGTAATWQRHTASYRDAAATLVAAADRRNVAETRQAFDRFNTTCARCHADHR